jgi:hypothetical protein
MKLFYVALGLVVFAVPAFADVYKGEAFSRERRVFTVGHKMIELLTNSDRHAPGMELSQAELDSLSYFFHYYQYSLAEIKEGQDEFYKMGLEKKLSNALMIEGITRISNFWSIRKSMDEHEALGELRCKFSYGDRLALDIKREKEEAAAAASAANAPTDDAEWDQILSDAKALSAQEDTRRIFGNCWDKEKYRE